jgi:hypothetical protein
VAEAVAQSLQVTALENANPHEAFSLNITNMSQVSRKYHNAASKTSPNSWVELLGNCALPPQHLVSKANQANS